MLVSFGDLKPYAISLSSSPSYSSSAMDDEAIDAKPDELSSQATPISRPSPEELVACAVAPVKAEYLRPPPVRFNGDEARGGLREEDDDAKEKKGTPSSLNVVKEKKSKRQLKRERKQEQKSVVHICTEVARSGNVDSCPYGGNCRFNHDLNAYLAQKPADLEGSCPFIALEQPCPYGLTCRFFNTHNNNIPSGPQNISRKNNEINILNKDLQKLLWKNKVSFPKADAQLKILGLKVANKTKEKSNVDHMETHEDNLDGSYDLQGNDINKIPCSVVEKLECAPGLCAEKDCSDDASVINGSSFINEPRPLKKTKSQVDENQKTDISSGTHFTEMDSKDTNELEKPSPDRLSSCKIDLLLKPHPRERKLIDFREKLYLAPLTTVGNLPFRRVCKVLGVDITCGEMAMCTNLLQGQASEWALLRRHSSEDIFGVQICGAYPDTVARTVELVSNECSVDFIDINMGCPIDIVVNKGAGSSLLTKPMRMKSIIQAACSTTDKPLTIKVRTGYFEGRNRIDSLVSDIGEWGASALTIHGRSRQQRYSKLADWDYIYQCAQKAPGNLYVVGNGDIFSYSDWNRQFLNCPKLSSCMIARGALIKPWIFTEIKEQRHWDITSGERLNILKDYVHFGLEHWGCDTKGVETTRHFLLEWLSYTYRYIPVGLLDVVPQRLNWRAPSYYGRNDLETLLASDSAADWIRISEMLLGKVPEGFSFAPKHKSNAYDRAENG